MGTKNMTENQKQTRVDCCRDLTQTAQADPDFLKGTLLVMKHGSTSMIQNQGNSRWNGVTPTPQDQRNFELKRVGRSS